VEKEMAHNRHLLSDPLQASIRKPIAHWEAFRYADKAASVFARTHTAVCHDPHSLVIARANGTPIVHTDSEFHGPKFQRFAGIGL
jgi:hypothetical protein